LSTQLYTVPPGYTSGAALTVDVNAVDKIRIRPLALGNHTLGPLELYGTFIFELA
jgi:hypothetical protein